MMNKFDKKIKNKIRQEENLVPYQLDDTVNKMLEKLPEIDSEYRNIRLFQPVLKLSFVIFVALILLPNISPTYAKVLEDIPLIGDIIKVVTVVEYNYQDDYHELKASIPQIETIDNPSYAQINNSVNKLINVLLERFYDEIDYVGENGHSSLYIDYSVVTNNDKWFTLKIQIIEEAGSGNIHYRYYHINKSNNEVVTLKDIVKDKQFYSIVENEIEQQMKQEMNENRNIIYWVDDEMFGDQVNIDQNTDFYWNKDYDLVICFDKYEVAPGYMGEPEFTINKDVVKDYIYVDYLFEESIK